MRYKNKIFIVFFVLILISITIVGYLIIKNTFRRNLEMQIEQSISQLNLIYMNYSLYENIDTMTPIINQYLQQNINIEIRNENSVLFSNITNNEKFLEMLVPNDSQYSKVYIKDEFLYTGFMKNDITIISKTNISSIYDFKKQQIKFFIEISFIFTFFVTIMIYLLVKILTDRIKILDKVARKISQNNDYNIRVPEIGNDEIGTLGKVINQMLNSINEDIENINKISNNRQEFINNLTHEIRTPLTSIVGFSSLIKNEKTTDIKKIKEYSTYIYNEGMFLKDLSTKLTEIILLDNKKCSKEKLNISEMLLYIISNLKIKFPNVIFNDNICEKCYKYIDKVLFKILIENIIKNSITAYEKNKNIIIEIILKDNILIIKDYGKGIKKSDLEKIKEPLYTTNYDRNKDISGLGLGLTICNKIIKYHDWTWRIDSEENSWTKTSIFLERE